MTDVEYTALERKVADLERKKAVNEGRRLQIMQRLQEEFGVQTDAEIEEKLRELQAEAASTKKVVDRLYKELMAKWGDKLQ